MFFSFRCQFSRNDIFNQLKQLHAHLINLQNLRAEHKKIDEQRTLLSKEAELVDEAETLGDALSNHSLNTLTQRYGAFKRAQNEFNACKLLLVETAGQYDKQMLDYRNCIDAFLSKEMANYLTDLNELLDVAQTQSPTREFDMVKEFLENSAQSAIYLQSCQISNELNVTVMQQFAMVKQSLETLLQYGAVVAFHSGIAHAKHRYAKYSEWANYLIEHQTVWDCRDVVTQFEKSFGKKAIAEIPLQKVIAFSYQIQEGIRSGQLKLQKYLERLNIEMDMIILPSTDITPYVLQFKQVHQENKATIANYLREGQTTGAMSALQCVILPVLTDLNKRILMMESAATNSAQNLVELTFNGKSFMDEMIVDSTIMYDLTNLIDTADREYKAKENNELNNFRVSLGCLKEVQNAYTHLQGMSNTFEMEILRDLIMGIVSEDHSIMDMVAAIIDYPAGIQKIPDLLLNLRFHLKRTVLSTKNTSIPSSLTPSLETCTREACGNATVLRNKLDKLKKQQEHRSTNGSKLFMKLMDMFEKLDEIQKWFTTLTSKLNVPDNWHKIDQLRDAWELAVSEI